MSHALKGALLAGLAERQADREEARRDAAARRRELVAEVGARLLPKRAGPRGVMRRVVVESPYAGDTARNVTYARRAIRDCLERGEARIASHLLFTQPGILRDEIAEERALGIEAGLVWMEVAQMVAFYCDYGFSNGMKDALEVAKRRGCAIVHRRIGENP